MPLPSPETSPFTAATLAPSRPVTRSTFVSTIPFAICTGAERSASLDFSKFCLSLTLLCTRPLISGSCGFGSFGSSGSEGFGNLGNERLGSLSLGKEGSFSFGNLGNESLGSLKSREGAL